MIAVPPPFPTPPPIPAAAHHLPSLRDLAVIVVILIIASALAARRKARPVVVMRQPVSPQLRKVRRALAVLVTGAAALVLLPSWMAAVALVVLAVLWKLAGKLR